MNLPEIQQEMLRLFRLLDGGIEALREQSRVLAEAENAYRRAKAEAWVKCPRDEGGNRDWTAGRREAWVNAATADLRQTRDIAEGMVRAALEAVRSRRQQLSALQSLMNAERSEMDLARTGPA